MNRALRIVTSLVAAAVLAAAGVFVSQLVAGGAASGPESRFVPPPDAVPLVTVGGSPGQPTFRAVSYDHEGSLCFDVEALTDVLTRGSIGGCGISDEVALGLISNATANEGAGQLPSWAVGLPANPTVLASGWIDVADAEGQDHLFGVAAGTVPCECSVTVAWDDGVTSSGEVTGGIFVVSRAYDDSTLAVGASPPTPASLPPQVASVTVGTH
jgi:hypothetical protein